MSLQNFVDNTLPTIKAAFLNQVDVFVNTLFAAATTAQAARVAIGAPGRVLLSTQTVSSVATVDFTGLTGYLDYEFVIQNLVPVSGAGPDLYVRVSQNNGSSYLASSNYEWGISDNAVFSGVNQGAGGDNQMKLAVAVGSIFGTSAAGYCGVFRSTNGMGNAVSMKTFRGQGVLSTNSHNTEMTDNFGTFFTNVTAINAIRFLFSAGNVSKGTIYCYGLLAS